MDHDLPQLVGEPARNDAFATESQPLAPCSASGDDHGEGMLLAAWTTGRDSRSGRRKRRAKEKKDEREGADGREGRREAGKRKRERKMGCGGEPGRSKALSRAPAVWGAWHEAGAVIPEAATWVELILRDLIQQRCEIINTFRRGCDKTRPISGLGCNV